MPSDFATDLIRPTLSPEVDESKDAQGGACRVQRLV